MTDRTRSDFRTSRINLDRIVLTIGLVLTLASCATTTSSGRIRKDRHPRLPETVQSKPIEVDASVPTRYLDAVRQAQAFGKLLYHQDTAAWVSTDAIIARGLIKKYGDKATGWISESQDLDGSLWDVVYTEQVNGKPFAFADVGVDLGHGKPRVEVHEHTHPRPLSERETALLLLRRKTLGLKWLRCAQRYNYATGFREQDGQEWIVVDLLPARLKADDYPLGGFHEFRYSLSKDSPIQHFSQTHACLNGSHPPIDASGGMTLNGFMITHITSDTPTQFHVFMSLSYGKPLYVLTVHNNLLWIVDKGNIRMLQDMSKDKKDK